MNEQPTTLKLTWRLVGGLFITEAAALVAVAAMVWLIWGAARAEPNDAALTAIKTELSRQVDAWNRGDLEGYMSGYWNNDAMTFYSGGDVTTGWKPTLERYRRRYQAEGKSMGKLTFSDQEIKILTDDTAFARGRWKLTMPDGSTSFGLFTVIMKRIDGNWRIVHDHSSIAEKK